MSNPSTRRRFVQKTAVSGLGLMYAPVILSQSSPNEQINVAIMGVNNRGNSLAKSFAYLDGYHVATICEVDERALGKTIQNVEKIQKSKPNGEKDIRKVVEDKSIDAVVIAAPDHWHAPAAILACQAGQHVYVEKPCSHNPGEGELLVMAAQKYNRVVQMGTQRRSWQNMIQCIQELKSGVIGRVYFGKGWYANARGSIGFGRSAPVPEWLDFDLWQGPASRRPFRDNLVHYNWHWFWHWGTGEALNNGTHALDLLRWGMDVDYPYRVNSAGGRYHFNDDQETPDTQVITLDFEDEKSIVWEGRSCNTYPIEESGFGTIFYGDKGTLVSTGNNYKIFANDRKKTLLKEVKEPENTEPLNTTGPGFRMDKPHLLNFANAIRQGTRLNSDIEDGNKSVLLGLLGNIAQRTGKTLYIDQRNGRIIGDKQAMQLWGREYEPGWTPVV